MQNQLQKAIDLSRKTGDRLIVFDKAESANPYVVMSLDDYEKLAISRNEARGLTERELLDKINRDIAIWKSENEFNGFAGQINEFNSINDIDNYGIDEFNEEDEYNEFNDTDNANEEDFSSAGLKKISDNFQKRKRGFGKRWAIPSDRKQGAEEVDEKEEDRQYLEEIPF